MEVLAYQALEQKNHLGFKDFLEVRKDLIFEDVSFKEWFDEEFDICPRANKNVRRRMRVECKNLCFICF